MDSTPEDSTPDTPVVDVARDVDSARDVTGARLGSAYQVVARRYRPQSFESLVGQSQVATALSNAINTDRVGHAYLFTGARGVGKTSAARIFAKCLNCELGPAATPCGKCEVCLAVNDGQDVDVLEIDGASNRGIDEIRELRANINVRPSRSRYKVYIIDEVHMLTMQAFNALLKTLEEPPTHVKFIFCTTDPEKIPITVLSRCQRFDFAPVEPDSICTRLAEICQSEGFAADAEALALVARRANGSMRDSQSLLEQLLSFCEQRISLADVNQMFGTADLGLVKSIVSEIATKNSRKALEELDESISRGVDPGQLGFQLVGFFRDILIVQNGCGKELLLTANPADFDQILELGGQLGVQTTLAVLQVFDECLTRLKSSSHPRTLLEMAIIRTCQLEGLEVVSSLIRQAKSGLELVVSGNPLPSGENLQEPSSKTPVREAQRSPETEMLPKKKQAVPERAPPSPVNTAPVNTSPVNTASVNPSNVENYWLQTLETIEDFMAEYARHYESVAISAPNCLAVTLDSFYKEKCDTPSIKVKFEETFAEITNHRFRIDFVAGDTQPIVGGKPAISKRQKMKDLEQHPLVRQAIDKFDGEIMDVRELKK